MGWSRKLPEPVEVGRRKLRTLHDLRAHLLSLTEEVAEKPGWKAATAAVLKASETGDVKNAAETLGFARLMHRDQ